VGVIGSDIAVCAFVLACIYSAGRKYGQNDVTAVRKKTERRQAGRTKKRRAGLTNGVTIG